MLKRLAIASVAFLASIAPASAVTRYVSTQGGSLIQCDGTVPDPYPGSGTGQPCAWNSVTLCNTSPTFTANSECIVEPGSYPNDVVAPRANNQTFTCGTGARGQNCVIVGGTASAADNVNLDLRGFDNTLVRGFKFRGGKAWLGNNGDTGNIVENFDVDDPLQTNIGPNFMECGVTTASTMSITLRNGSIGARYKSVNTNLLVLQGNASTAQNVEMFGWWNGIAVNTCTNCVLDGVYIHDVKNHIIEVNTGATNTTIKNSRFYGGSFREFPFHVAAPVSNINFYNNVFLTGKSGNFMPDIGHEGDVSGTWNIINNLFINYGSGSEAFIILNNSNTSGLVWNIDYNGYVGRGNPTGTAAPWWIDNRGGVNRPYYPDANSNGIIDDTAGTTDFQDWQTLDLDPGAGTSNPDVHSVAFVNTDYRNSTFGSAGTLWGQAAPMWGGFIDDIPNVDSDGIANNEICVETYWSENYNVGDFIEYNADGTARTISAITSPPNAACVNQTGRAIAKFTPGLSSGVQVWRYISSWGRTNPSSGGPVAAKTWLPSVTSPIVNAGSNASCGHTTSDGVCDIGPVEANATPTWRINSMSQGEGTTPMVFTVSLQPVVNQTTTVVIASADGTATQPADYTQVASQTLTFTPNQANTIIPVTIVQDALVEGNHTFTLTLSSPSAGTSIGVAAGTGTIVDDDAASAFTVNDPTVLETDGFCPFTVTLLPASSVATDISYITSDGTATAPGDYTALLETTQTIAAGTTTATVNVPVVADSVPGEGDETLTLTLNGVATSTTTLGNTTDAHAITRAHNRKTVFDPTGGRWYAFWLDEAGLGSAMESHSSDGITWSSAVALDATQGAGFTAFDVQVVGADLYILMRTAAPSTTVLPDKYVVRRYTVGGGGALTLAATSIVHYCGPGSTSSVSSCAAATGDFTIHFYGNLLFDTAGYFWVSAMVADGGSTTHVEVIRSNAITGVPATDFMTWGNAGCNGAVAGDCNNDWTTPALGGGLSWGQGEKGTMLLDLDNGLGGNDVGLMVYDKGSDSVAKAGQLLWSKNSTAGHTGWSAFTQLSALPNQYQTCGSAGADPTRLDDRRASCLVDPATSLIHCVYVNNDTGTSTQANLMYFTYNHNTSTKSADSTLYSGEVDGVQLSIDTNAAPSTLRAFYIENHHTAGTCGGSPANYYMKMLTNASLGGWGSAASAPVVSDAANRMQYPQTPETVPASGTILVMTQDNAGGSTYNIVVRTVKAVPTITDATGTCTIRDTSIPPRVSINDATVTEGDSSTQSMTFTVSLDAPPTAGNVIVAYQTNDGTASAPGDYTGASGSLTFANPTTTQQFTVPIVGDTTAETPTSETFTVTLTLTSPPGTATILDGTGVGTIVDNDSASPTGTTTRFRGTPVIRGVNVNPYHAPTGTYSAAAPTSCGTLCFNYQVTLTCPGLDNAVANVQVRNKPLTTPALGAIVFFQGGTGNGLWSSASSAAAAAILNLNNAGYRTIEIGFTTPTQANGGWYGYTTATQNGLGPEASACRPATAIKWAYETQFASGNPSLAFCGTGNSTGATALMYAIQIYGEGAMFDFIAFDSGPPISDMQLGCSSAAAAASTYGFPVRPGGGGKGFIDTAFGYAIGTGPCSQYGVGPFTPSAYDDILRNSGHYSNTASKDHGVWAFPDLRLQFVFGDDDTPPGCSSSTSADCTNAPNLAKLVYNRLVARGQPNGMIEQCTFSSSSNVGHGVSGSSLGAQYIEDLMLANCVPQPTGVNGSQVPCP